MFNLWGYVMYYAKFREKATVIVALHYTSKKYFMYQYWSALIIQHITLFLKFEIVQMLLDEWNLQNFWLLHIFLDVFAETIAISAKMAPQQLYVFSC